MVVAISQFLGVAGTASAQLSRGAGAVLHPDDEAPPALLSLDRMDGDVDLYLIGSWLASTRFATGFALHPPLPDSNRRITAPYDYPGFETELFSQTLDLVLSLWLYNRYFFEAGFADDSSMNTLATGYIASGDELVQELVVGNVPLAVERYPYQYAGSPGARAGRLPAPGAVLRLQTARTYHEILVQLENSRPEIRRFSGGGAQEEARIRPEDYARGRVFALPHRPVRNVSMYIEDEDGSTAVQIDGTTRTAYRRLDTDRGEYVLDGSRGVVSLDAGLGTSRQILAVYDPVGAPGDGTVIGLDSEDTPDDSTIDFPLEPDGGAGRYGTADIPLDRYRVQVMSGVDANRRGVLLQEPGLFTPFEATNFYPLPQQSQDAVQRGDARIRLVRRGTRTPVADEGGYLLTPVAGGRALQVTVSGADPGTLLWAFPFADRPPRGAHAALYGPRSSAATNRADFDILVEYRSAETGLFLDGDIVPGTVGVTRNGSPVPGTEVDYSTGEIRLPDGIGPDAEIDVRYRVYSPEAAAGDLVAITGNRWEVHESLILTAAAGLRWTVAEDRYSQELDEHPGRITLSLGAEYLGDTLRIAGAAAFQVYQPDTTGYMRLFGGRRDSFAINPRATSLFPAAVPPGVVSPATRTIAPYRDFWTTDLLGNSSLGNYADTRTADEIDREGARMGPYLARSSDTGFSGTVGVLEWNALEPGRWVGAQVRVTEPPVDLRDARTITIRYRYIPEDGTTLPPPELLVHLGALGEDLDGDGLIDRGRSALDPTLEFTFPAGHPEAGAVRRVGQDAPGLAAPHREDAYRDGILRSEPVEGVLDLSSQITLDGTVGTDDGWRVARATLSAGDAARLSETRGIRFIVRDPGDPESGSPDPESAGGRLLLGEVTVERSGNATVIAGATRGGRTRVTGDPADPTLRATSPVVRDRFVPNSSDQYVLQVSWDADGSTPETAGLITAEFSIPEFSPDRYGELAFFSYLDAGPVGDFESQPAARVTLTLSPRRDAPESESLVVRLPAWVLATGATGPWRKLVLDQHAGTVSVDGETIPGAEVIQPRNGDELLRVATLSVEGIPAAGNLYFDELHAADPQAGTATAGRLSVIWTPEITTGDLKVEQNLDVQTEGFRNNETTTSSAGIRSESRVAYRLNSWLVAGEAIFRGNDRNDPTGALGHHVIIPVGRQSWTGLRVEDRLFRDFDSRGALIAREIGISAGSERIGRYRYAHRHRVDHRETMLRWNALVQPPPIRALSLTLEGTAELRDLDRLIASGDYGRSWVESGQYFLPPGPSGADTRQERHVDGTLRTAWSPSEVVLAGGWRNRTSTAGTQENHSTLRGSFPIRFEPAGARPWSLTPGYERTYRSVERSSTTTMGGDFSLWTDAIGDDPVLFTAIPLAELFLDRGHLEPDQPRPAGVERHYAAEARLRYSRAFASRLQDLWTPAEVQTSLRRVLQTEQDTTQDTRTWQLTATAIAINLFGEQGSRPMMQWYRSDEFRNQLAVTITESVPGDISRTEVELQQETTLVGVGSRDSAGRGDQVTIGDDEITFRGGARFVITEAVETVLSAALTYQWYRPGHPPLAVLERLEEAPYYRHSESLGWDGTYREGELRGSELTLAHETALVIGSNGEVRLFGKLGWLVDPAEYDQGALHVFGFLAGIEGVLQY